MSLRPTCPSSSLGVLAATLLSLTLAACGGAATTATDAAAPGTAAPDPRRTDDRFVLPRSLEAMLTAQTDIRTLDGLRIIHKATPGNDVVAAGLFLQGGAAHWRPDRLGDEQLGLQVLAAAGPAHLSKDAFHAALDRRGATLSASSGREFASVAVVGLQEDFDAIWALLVDALEDPELSPEEIALQRQRQLSRIATELDDPDRAIATLGRRAFFEGQPEALSPLGTAESVASLTPEDLRRALDALLQRDRAILIVVGALDPAAVTRAARALLDRGVLPASGPDLAEEPALPRVLALPTAPRVDLHHRANLPTTYALGYFAAPAPDHPDHAALAVAVRLLSDRFFEEVRTRRNLAYAVSAGLGPLRHNVGWFHVTTTRPHEALEAMHAVVDDLVAGAVTAQDIAEQTETALTELYMGLQSNQAQASMLARWAAVTGDPRWADAHLARFRAVTPEEVRGATERWIRNIHLTVLSPEDPDTLEPFPMR